jgi:hypothetical protein
LEPHQGCGNVRRQGTYIQYWGSCHGEDGRGGGPVSAYLKIKVPNLTLLKKNNKGIYPMDNVMSAIDGRRTVRAHGDRKMPFGERFSEKKPKAENMPSFRLSSRLNLSRSTLQQYRNSRLVPRNGSSRPQNAFP